MGKKITRKRKVSRYGDLPYTYSGVKKDPEPWMLILSEIMVRIEKHLNLSFNSCRWNKTAQRCWGFIPTMSRNQDPILLPYGWAVVGNLYTNTIGLQKK